MMLIFAPALTLGLSGGYAWSLLNAPPARPPAPRKAAFVPLPSSPEERPAVLDREWAERADDHPAPATDPAAAEEHR